jgi:hypothetical protein
VPRAAAANLVHDTVYRRSRRAVIGALHGIDSALNRFRGSRVRVLFEAASPMSMTVFRPMFDRLRGDPRLEFWFTTCDQSWQATSIFGRLDAGQHVITPAEARWRKFDAYVNTDFWDMTWLPRRTRRMHLFHGVAGKYGLDAPTRIAPMVATFDRLLFPNHDRLHRYAEAGLVDASSDRAALVGYPKVDCLVDGSLNRVAIESALGLEAGRPTVLYAPTWSPYSSLNVMGMAIVDALSRLDVNMIVKLHDRSYDGAARASGGIDWRRELEPFCHTRGVHLAVDADASPYMCVSDALVTDHSSVGFEYMLLDRPLVVVDCPELLEKARINPQKSAALRHASDVVHSAAETAEAVQCALDHPEAHSRERRATAGELFFQAGSAASRAVECFYNLIALEAPVPASGAARSSPTLDSAFNPFEARTT